MFRIFAEVAVAMVCNCVYLQLTSEATGPGEGAWEGEERGGGAGQREARPGDGGLVAVEEGVQGVVRRQQRRTQEGAGHRGGGAAHQAVAGTRQHNHGRCQ